MTDERKIQLAKLNSTEQSLKADMISKDIRVEHNQADVEALVCNALADIIEQLKQNGCVTNMTEHLKEFEIFNAQRVASKQSVKAKF